jgi:hypothetical protein
VAGGRQVKEGGMKTHLCLSDFGDGFHIEQLTGVILDAREPDESDLISLLLDDLEDVLRSESRLVWAGRELDEIGRRIEVVQVDVGLDGVLESIQTRIYQLRPIL